MSSADSLPFAQVDVFTAVPFMGNPVAVVFDADALSGEAMQAIASWTNLSETTFVLAPTDAGAHYRLRIFTPRAELPFAGHPTIGSAHAVLESGRVVPDNGRIVQQSAVGLVPITVPDDWRAAGLSFRLPDHQITLAPEPALLMAALGTAALAEPVIVDVGPRWVIVEVEDAGVVEALTPDFARLAAYDLRHGTTGLTVFGHCRDAAGTQKVRSFAPADGINEDPVCGSGNGAVAAYRLAQGQTRPGDSYTASQGAEVGRLGRVHIRYGDDGIHVGGCAVTCISGTLRTAI